MKKLILSAAFLGLGVFGFAQTTSDRKGDFEQKKAARMQEMKQELNLTDAQVAQIKALHEKKAAERKQEMAAKKQDRMKMMKDNEAEMQKILTPDQFKKFQALKEKKMAERKEHFQKRKAANTAVVK
ncbi:Spy/CpxP family protein refolding chaperone [Epilithonimonas vandammei]|uniref:Spy/CpxP family protein refolding chaperone n=1 Tax=Epilithonimonas vandammei TaxID=2487072 RepID=UPI0028A6D81A|nr:Spy/CpxP family protein refolding chaperone [Epilithonimonas vandammei]